VCHVFVLELGALPNLNLATAAEHSDTHGREEIVGSVGVKVDATVKNSRSVSADGRVDKSLTARMVLDEVANIVDDAGDGRQGFSIFPGIGNEVVPVDNGQLLERNAPVEGSTLLVEGLLLLLKPAFLNLVGTELLQVVGQPEEAHYENEPLCGIVL